MEEALSKVHITVNKNTVPNETRSPFVTSGNRLGTPALSSPGMGSKEMTIIGDWIYETYKNIQQESALLTIGEQVKTLGRSFPLYPEWKG